MVSWQTCPSLPPRAPLAFLSRLKLPFPSLSNACHAGYPSRVTENSFAMRVVRCVQHCCAADREGRKAKKCEIGQNVFHLFSTLHSLPLSYLEFRNFHFLSSCLSCWQNSGLDTSSPETQGKFCICGNR